MSQTGMLLKIASKLHHYNSNDNVFYFRFFLVGLHTLEVCLFDYSNNPSGSPCQVHARFVRKNFFFYPIEVLRIDARSGQNLTQKKEYHKLYEMIKQKEAK